MLGFSCDTKLPEFDIHIMHKGADTLSDHTEIMVIHLLSLRRRCTEQGSAGKDNILSLKGFLLIHQEIFLLRSHRRNHFFCLRITKETNQSDCLFAERFHGSQKRCFLIKSFSCIRTESRGNTKSGAGSCLFDKSRRCNIPCGVSSGLKGSAKASRWERRCIRLSFDQFLSRKFHQHFSVCIRMGHKGVVLFRCDTGQRLEPMGIMSCPVFHRPVLHGLCDHIGRLQRKFPSFLCDFDYFPVHVFGQTFPHRRPGEDFAAKQLLYAHCLVHLFSSSLIKFCFVYTHNY